MDHLAPPMYDVINIDIWKVRMSAYLKTLGLHVYIATTKKTYFDNDKYIEANAQTLYALKHSLSKEYLSLVLIDIPLLQCGYIDLSQVTNNKQCGERI